MKKQRQSRYDNEPVRSKAQVAVQVLFPWLVKEVARPITNEDLDKLHKLLAGVEANSIWGLAISDVMHKDGDVNFLIEQLSSQAIDEPITMVNIVGLDATILLLRSFKQ